MNEVILQQYKYSDLHEIYLVFLSQFNTLASEVKCLRVIERRDLSNEQNTFKSKTIFYHNKTRLKPERATRPIPKRRPLYATATRPIPKRRRPLYVSWSKAKHDESEECDPMNRCQGAECKEGRLMKGGPTLKG